MENIYSFNNGKLIEEWYVFFSLIALTFCCR
jgi:hypothetical protein